MGGALQGGDTASVFVCVGCGAWAQQRRRQKLRARCREPTTKGLEVLANLRKGVGPHKTLARHIDNTTPLHRLARRPAAAERKVTRVNVADAEAANPATHEYEERMTALMERIRAKELSRKQAAEDANTILGHTQVPEVRQVRNSCSAPAMRRVTTSFNAQPEADDTASGVNVGTSTRPAESLRYERPPALVPTECTKALLSGSAAAATSMAPRRTNMDDEDDVFWHCDGVDHCDWQTEHVHERIHAGRPDEFDGGVSPSPDEVTDTRRKAEHRTGGILLAKRCGDERRGPASQPNA